MSKQRAAEEVVEGLGQPAEFCNCLKLVNEALEKHGSNTRLATDMCMNFKTGKARVVMKMATEKADNKKRERLRSIHPSYCPFCGEPYREDVKRKESP